MKKLLIPLLGILALASTACEQHSAAELRNSQKKHRTHEKPEIAGDSTEKAEPKAKANPEESGTPPKFFPKK